MTRTGRGGKMGWRALRSELQARLASGHWGAGGRLPSETELAAEFGVSRATMNRALGALAEDGLIDRRRRAGSRVLPAPRRAARFAIPVVRDEIAATGAAYGYALIAREAGPAPDWLRARMGLGAGAQVLHILCLHSAGSVPFQLEERWISLEALPEAAGEAFRDRGPTEWLIATVPYSEVEMSFLAEGADRAWAGLLGMEAGEPVFTAERTTWWQGRAITHVRLRYRRGYRMTTRY
ncbi:MAG: GntR family transcriptional regulator [Rhodobacteraceae bacterium]|nr:GntR family transcriptional regulator [Paracoccaceae bacterium]